MSKAILLSIHPKWAKLIYEGKKTIEWRKSFPKEFISNQTKVYLYETAGWLQFAGFLFLRWLAPGAHREEKVTLCL